jgi:hypothetical protein
MSAIDTWLHCAFIKTVCCRLSLVASGMWPFSYVFAEPMVAQYYSHWEILASWSYQGDSTFLWIWASCLLVALCASTLGIKTLSQAYALVRINLHTVGWSSSFFYPFGWRIISGIIETLFVAYSILLGCYVLFHGQAFSFGNTVWVVFLDKYPWRTQMA